MGKNAKGAASTPLTKSTNAAADIDAGTEKEKPKTDKELREIAASANEKKALELRNEIVGSLSIDNPPKEGEAIKWDDVPTQSVPLSLFAPAGDMVPKLNVLQSMEMQTRVKKLDGEHVERMTDYLSDPANELPPVKVVVNPEDSNHVYLVDGHHTLTAYTKMELSDTNPRTHIPAKIVYGSELDARISALGQNTKHGLPLTKKDIQNKVKIVLADPDLNKYSANALATMFGISQPTFSKYRSQMESEGTVKVGRDGKALSVNQTTKGKAKATKDDATAEAERDAQAEAIRNKTFALPDTDVLGTALPEDEELRTIFQYGKEMRGFLAGIQSQRKQLRAYVNKVIAEHSDPVAVSRLIADYKDADKQMRDALSALENNVIPYALDPYTKGRNRRPANKSELSYITGVESGEELRNPGYATKAQMSVAPEHLITGEQDAWESGYWDEYTEELNAQAAAREEAKRLKKVSTTLKAKGQPQTPQADSNAVAVTNGASNDESETAVTNANETLEAAANEALNAALSGDDAAAPFSLD